MFFAVIITLSMITTVSAEGEHILDSEGYFSSEELVDLEKMAQHIEDTYDYRIMFCITDSVNTETTYDYAEAIYKESTNSDKGLVLVHNTGDKVFVVYATEESEKLFTEEIQDELGEVYNQSDTYFGGVSDYYYKAETVILNSNSTSADDSTNGDIPDERTLPLVVDNADLLTDSEESKLTSKLEAITDTYKIEASILTVSDLEDKTPQAYADDFFDYNGYGYGEEKDGLLVLYKPGAEGERKLHITTHGKAIEYFTDSTIDSILYAMKDHLVAEDYYKAFEVFANNCDTTIAQASAPPSVHWVWIPVCLVVGFIISSIITKILVSSLTNVKLQKNASNFVRQGSMILTDQRDVFLYRNVTKTEIPDDDDDSSSTHESSSGETHGGGGISF